MGGRLGERKPEVRTQKHPLQISMVLDRLFCHLNVKDLKICRLVCSLWNAEVLASNSWKMLAQVCIKDGLATDDFVSLLEQGSGLSSFKNYVVGKRFSGLDTASICFWSCCGDFIKILELQGTQFDEIDDFRTAIYKACPNMERLTLSWVIVKNGGSGGIEEPTDLVHSSFAKHRKLKSLHIHRRVINCSSETYGVSWMELLDHFPQLNNLELYSGCHNFIGLMRSFGHLRRQNSTSLQLKNFAFKVLNPIMNPFPGLLEVLKDPGLQLESITLSHICKDEHMKEILGLHAASLKKLHLSCVAFSFETCLDPHRVFPLGTKLGYLEALRELELTLDTFQSLAVLKLMPNLECLRIEGTSTPGIISRSQWSDMEGFSAEKCKELTVNMRRMPKVDLEKLITWIPNVEKLRIGELGNPHFQKICESWPRLVTLILEKSWVDDCGFSGLDKEDVDIINRLGECSSWRPITVPRPNISSLKEMRNFYLGGTDGCKLGYCGAVYGIEQLPNLKQFHVENYNILGLVRLQQLVGF